MNELKWELEKMEERLEDLILARENADDPEEALDLQEEIESLLEDIRDTQEMIEGQAEYAGLDDMAYNGVRWADWV